jgi:hypothetical protein
MTENRGASAATRVSAGTNRVVRAWRATPHEHRLAAYASIGLFLTLFLPWYQVTVIDTTKTTKLQSLTESLTGWGAFSFVEAAVLLVAAGVLILLFQRAEGHAFHLPGGDGGVITAAGIWTSLLIIWRIFDKQGTSGHGQYATTSGIEWGIFVALGVAAFLAYAGSRIRAAHRPEPPLPGEAGPVGESGTAPTEAVPVGVAAGAAEARVGRARPTSEPRPVRPPRPVRASEQGTTRTPTRDRDAPTGDRNAPTGDRNAPTRDGNAPTRDGNAPPRDGNAPPRDPQTSTAPRTPTAADQPPRRRSRKRWSPDREAAPAWDDGSQDLTPPKPRSAPPPRSVDPSEVTTRRDRRSDVITPRDRGSQEVADSEPDSEDVTRVDAERARRRSPEGRPPPPSTQAARSRRRPAPEGEDVTLRIDRDQRD